MLCIGCLVQIKRLFILQRVKPAPVQSFGKFRSKDLSTAFYDWQPFWGLNWRTQFHYLLYAVAGVDRCRWSSRVGLLSTKTIGKVLEQCWTIRSTINRHGPFQVQRIKMALPKQLFTYQKTVNVLHSNTKLGRGGYTIRS